MPEGQNVNQKTINVEAAPEGPLGQAWMKLSWAEMHRQSLLAHMQVYAANIGDFMTLNRTLDRQTGTFVISVDAVTPPPSRFALILGDFLTNARAALDYAAWKLVSLGSQHSSFSEQQVGFTIEEHEFGSKRSFEASVTRQMPGVKAEHLAVVRAHQPFRRPKDPAAHPLAILRRLSNIDKHRQLHFAVPFMPGETELKVETADYELEEAIPSDDLKKCVTMGFFPGAVLITLEGRVTGPQPHVSLSLDGSQVFLVREGERGFLIPELLVAMVSEIASLLDDLEQAILNSQPDVKDE